MVELVRIVTYTFIYDIIVLQIDRPADPGPAVKQYAKVAGFVVARRPWVESVGWPAPGAGQLIYRLGSAGRGSCLVKIRERG